MTVLFRRGSLGNQACFAHVAAGGRAAYVTLLAETHAHMFAHLNKFDFFDPALIGSSLLYYGGYGTIESSGLDGLTTFLRDVMRGDGVTFLVVDGLFTAYEASSSALVFRTFLVNLQSYAETIGCTTLLLTQTPTQGVRDPSYTIVDGVVELGMTSRPPRIVREIEVHKFRGSASRRGRHVFDIGTAGITVHPRIEVVPGAATPTTVGPRSRVSTGLVPLDAMLDGGLLSGSTTMLFGPSGSGKTLLGLHFLDAGARMGEQGLHVGFYETPSLLVETAASIGLASERHHEEGRLTLLWQPSLEESEDALAARLFAVVQDRGIRRLVIDGLEGFLQAAMYPERLGRFFTALALEMRARDVTTLIVVEQPTLDSSTTDASRPGLSYLVENIMVIRTVERRAQLYRFLSIVKTRGSDHDSSLRRFTIGAAGLVLAPASVGDTEILDGDDPSQGAGRTPESR